MARLLSLILLSFIITSPALAGTCRHYANGGGSITTCDNGSVTVYGRHHTEQYGRQNGGFDYYGGDMPDYYYRRSRRR